MKKVLGVISAALLALAITAPAQALDLRVGGNVNFGTDNDFGVGPRIELEINDYVPGLRLVADYHRFFKSNVYSDISGLAVESSSWDVGFHVLYDVATVPVGEGATIYVGAGMLYAERSYDHWLKASEGYVTDVDLGQKLMNDYKSASGVSGALIVGSTFNTGWTVIPYVEARYTIGVIDELMLSAGLLFSTGGGGQ